MTIFNLFLFIYGIFKQISIITFIEIKQTGAGIQTHILLNTSLLGWVLH